MRIIFIFIICVITLITGCRGIPKASEIQSQKQLKTVTEIYRPGNIKPTLPQLTQQSPLSDYLIYGIFNSPATESAYYEWMGSVKQITVERSLPDPKFTFQADILDVVKSVMPGLMIEIPGGGKLEARANIASEESRIRYFKFERTVLQTAFEITRSYYRIYFLQDKIRVNKKILNLLNELESIARRRNELNLTSLQDVLKIQIEQERIKTEIANLEDSRKPMIALFKGALGIKPDEPDPTIPVNFYTVSLELTEGNILKEALEKNSDIKAIESEIDRARAAIQLAQREKIPDYTAAFEVDAKSTPIMTRPQLGITLPIWRDKIAAQIAASESAKKSIEARLTDAQINLAIAIAEQLFIYNETTRTIHILKEQLIPMAQQSVEISTADYSSGKTEFASVLENWKTLYNMELELVEANTRRNLAIAELKFIIISAPPQGAPFLKTK